VNINSDYHLLPKLMCCTGIRMDVRTSNERCVIVLLSWSDTFGMVRAMDYAEVITAPFMVHELFSRFHGFTDNHSIEWSWSGSA